MPDTDTPILALGGIEAYFIALGPLAEASTVRPAIDVSSIRPEFMARAAADRVLWPKSPLSGILAGGGLQC